MADIAELQGMIEPAVEAEGFALVRVKMLGGTSDPTLQVMAERPDTRQLSLDDCALLSRRISEILDAADPIDGGYRLEVSSPGIDRPLTRLQDYADWQGHQVRMSLVEPVLERRQLAGPLLGVDRDLIGVDVPGHGPMWVTLANVHAAKLLMTDDLVAATAPLSAVGADETDISDEREIADENKIEGQD